jgi:hypothetical protein
LVRSNIDFKERIKKIDIKKLRDQFLILDEVRAMKKEEICILVNMERFRRALSGGEGVEWDLEKIELKS